MRHRIMFAGVCECFSASVNVAHAFFTMAAIIGKRRAIVVDRGRADVP